jgi:hypothetical protein
MLCDRLSRFWLLRYLHMLRSTPPSWVIIGSMLPPAFINLRLRSYSLFQDQRPLATDPESPTNQILVAPHVGGHGNVIQPIRGRGEMVGEPIIWCFLSNAFCDSLRRYHPLTLGPFPLSNQTVTRALRPWKCRRNSTPPDSRYPNLA